MGGNIHGMLLALGLPNGSAETWWRVPVGQYYACEMFVPSRGGQVSTKRELVGTRDNHAARIGITQIMIGHYS